MDSENKTLYFLLTDGKKSIFMDLQPGEAADAMFERVRKRSRGTIRFKMNDSEFVWRKCSVFISSKKEFDKDRIRRAS